MSRELRELPCSHCAERIAEVFLVFVDACHALPFAAEVCQRCAAMLSDAQQGEVYATERRR